MISDSDLPIIIPNVTLLSPGTWNGNEYTSIEIENGFKKTDWSDKSNYALIYSHDERAENWVGNIINPKVENGILLGDLELWDKPLAIKLKYGKAKLGISAKVRGMVDDYNRMIDMSFHNFSCVYDPACRNAFINLSKKEGKKLDTEVFSGNFLEIKELSNEITASDVKGSKIDGHVNQKIKYPKRKKKCLEELGEKYDKAISDIKDSLKKQHPKWTPKKIESTAYAIATSRHISKLSYDEDFEFVEDEEMDEKDDVEVEGGIDEKLDLNNTERRSEIMEEKTVNENVELKVENLEFKELGSKIDLILSEVKSLSERITKLETPVVPVKELKEEVKAVVEVKEEPKEEVKPEPEETELHKLQVELERLRSENAKAKSHTIQELSSKGISKDEAVVLRLVNQIKK